MVAEIDRVLKRLYVAAEVVALGAVPTALALTAGAREWQPLGAVLVLGTIIAMGEQLTVRIRGQCLTPSFIALTLTICFLGPLPAIAFLIPAMAYSSRRARLRPLQWLNNIVNSLVFPLVGGLLARDLLGPGLLERFTPSHAALVGLDVLAVFVVANTLNYLLLALNAWASLDRPLGMQFKTAFLPLLPAQLAAAVLTALLGIGYAYLGIYVVVGTLIVLGIFQQLVAALVRSEERAAELAARSVQLSSLQLGVLTTLSETLSMRSPRIASHQQAVAKYARALAREVGLGDREQELVHTAALLHDIGMFVLPDRLLTATLLSDDDWAAIRRHPYDGARFVGRLSGYGAVAEIILAHHERFDGTGYPAGLIASEIPIAARILAICEAYDALTSPHSYKPPISPHDAVKELRKQAGRQFDPELVSRFIGWLERETDQLHPLRELHTTAHGQGGQISLPPTA